MCKTLIFFETVGLLLLLVAIPLLLKKVPPNRWYGFRVSATLKDPALWYQANVYIAKYISGIGVILMAVAFLFYFLEIGGVLMCSLLGIGVWSGVILMAIQGFRFLRKAKR